MLLVYQCQDRVALVMGILDEQKELCAKFGVKFVASHSLLKVGISRNVKDGIMPINGLRHSPEGDTSGWYIWAGVEFS